MRRGTNLATRPFYNVRAVHVLLGVAAVLVIAFTVFNVVEFSRLRAAENTLGSDASDSEAQAQKMRADAAAIRKQIDQKELELVSAAAREANAIIDRRAFSWTELLTQLEATLPADVRITSVVPRLEEGVFMVEFNAEARRTEDVADFIEALEKTGAFRDVVPRRQSEDEDGLLTVTLDSVYTPPQRDARPDGPAQAHPGASRE